MKTYGAAQIRNIGLAGHVGSGKTSLAEAMLFTGGTISRLGKVDDGTSTLDYDPEEQKRKISINATFTPCEWKDNKINIVDTPGYADFLGEVKGALRVVDTAVIVLDAVAGLEVGSERAWSFADEYHLPKVAFVNKMEREHANFANALETLRHKYGTGIVPLQLPIGAEDNFRGIINLLKMKAYFFEKDRIKEDNIPADMESLANDYREKLTEAVAEVDDELLMKYLDGQELSPDELLRALKTGIRVGKVVPVLCGSALKNLGTALFLDAILDYLPSPAEIGEARGENPKTKEEVSVPPDPSGPFSAFVWKTLADPYVGKLTYLRVYSGTMRSNSSVHNANKGEDERIGQLYLQKGKEQVPVPQVEAGDLAAIAKLQATSTGHTLCDKDKPITFPPISFPRPVYSMAIQPVTKADLDKLSQALSRLSEEDPTSNVRKDTETGEAILSGMGESHIEILAERLKKKFGVNVTTSTPKVPYKETVRSSTKVQGKYKRQTGGHGQYGDVWLEIQPLPPGTGFEFAEKIVGGAVPKQYIPAVEKGIREALNEGVLAGYPLVDLKTTLYDGSYHPVDSSEMAFKIAGSMALKKGVTECQPVILEPIMNVEVIVPEGNMGDCMGDLNSKRGKILGMEPQGNGLQLIRAQVPLAEMFKYATDLRSLTQGRGTFTMEFSHYEEVPAHLAQRIIEEAKKAAEEGKD